MNAAPQAESNGSATKTVRSRPTRVLPTDRISIAKQFDLLRIYASTSGPTKKPVTLAEVESIINMKASTISLASPFFTDTGLLQKMDKGFIPSDAVLNFQRAYQWNPETATQKLAPVIAGSWFAEALLPKLSYRTISEDEAINDLAEACAADPDYKPQLSLLLDYMAAAGVISREGGQVKATSGPVATERVMLMPKANTEPGSGEMPIPMPTTITPATGTMTLSGKPAFVTATTIQPAEGTVQFHVSVRVDMAEFAGWEASRITAFFSGIAQVLAAKGALEKNTGEK